MNNFSDFFTVYESKIIYLTPDELEENGYDGIEFRLENACKKTISSKTKIYVSRLQVYNIKRLKKIDAYEVHYYHIHYFDTNYIESLVKSFYKGTDFKVKSIYITSDKKIDIKVILLSDMRDVNEITKDVRIKKLRKRIKKYVTIGLNVECEVRINKVDFEVLRFKI